MKAIASFFRSTRKLIATFGFAVASVGCSSEAAPSGGAEASADDLRTGNVVTVAEVNLRLPTLSVQSLVSDGTNAYWYADRSIWRAPLSGQGPTTKLLVDVPSSMNGGIITMSAPGQLIVAGDDELRTIAVDLKDPEKWKSGTLGKVALDYPDSSSIDDLNYVDGYVYFSIMIGTAGDVFRVRTTGGVPENLSAEGQKTYAQEIRSMAATPAGVFWTTFWPGVQFRAHGSNHTSTIPAPPRSAVRVLASGTSAFWNDGGQLWIGTVDPRSGEGTSRPLMDEKTRASVSSPSSFALAVDAKRVYWVSGGNIVATTWPSGAETVVLAKGQDRVADLTVDSKNVSWSVPTSDVQTIVRSVKKPF